MYAWAHAGVSMVHSSAGQYTEFPHVPISQLAPGDLVFFGSPIHHVGMYVGRGTMVEAPHTGAFVKYSSIYRDDYTGAARP
jgi:cell wall-associated NlpC family hydrolase